MTRHQVHGSSGILVFTLLFCSTTFGALRSAAPADAAKSGAALSAVIVEPAPRSQGNASGKTNYYVAPQGNDASDGSHAHPWATITHASKMIGQGATVHVAPGNYDENVATEASGTASARITYISDKRWGAVLAPTTKALFVWKNTGDYSDIINFESAGANCNGIGLGGSYQKAAGNNVHNAATGCNDREGGSGMSDYEYQTHDDDIIGNYVHDVGAADRLCGQKEHRRVQGIYQSNAGGHIQNNIVANNCVFGIHLWHAATHASISNNTVLNNRGGGILIGSGDSPCNTTGCPGGNDYTVVRNNIVANNGNPELKGWGIVEGGGAAGVTGIHNVYSHNLSFHNASGDFAFNNRLVCANCVAGKDPMLTAPTSGDFHLQKGSPALGSGTRQDAPQADYDGKPRNSVDIGASAVQQ
jgi:Protein of unknown function (DUF1565)